jgi:hypothetical protein
VLLVTVAPLVLLKFVEGLHAYEFAPLAMMLTVEPAQVLGLVTVTNGLSIITIDAVADAEHVPFEPINVAIPTTEFACGE